MEEIKMIEKDFLGLIDGLKNNTPKEILLLQAEGIIENYRDYIKISLTPDSYSL